MEQEDRETLRHISETLDEILSVQKKPQSKVERFVNLFGTGITILGILTIIDIIMKWIGG